MDENNPNLKSLKGGSKNTPPHTQSLRGDKYARF